MRDVLDKLNELEKRVNEIKKGLGDLRDAVGGALIKTELEYSLPKSLTIERRGDASPLRIVSPNGLLSLGAVNIRGGIPCVSFAGIVGSEREYLIDKRDFVMKECHKRELKSGDIFYPIADFRGYIPEDEIPVLSLADTAQGVAFWKEDAMREYRGYSHSQGMRYFRVVEKKMSR